MFDFLFGSSVDAILRSLNKCVERLEALQQRNAARADEVKQRANELLEQHSKLSVENGRAAKVASNIRKLISAE